MALIMGYVKDLDIAVPLGRQLRIRDPRDGTEHDAWEILLRDLDEAMWPKLLADMRARFPDAPKDDMEFRRALVAQGGLPIRADRVDVVYDLRGFL